VATIKGSSKEIVLKSAKNLTRILPNPIGETCSKISSPFASQVKTSLQEKQQIKIALVSLEMPDFLEKAQQHSIVPGEKPRTIDAAACDRWLLHWNSKDMREMHDRFSIALQSAIDQHNADVVCINELGFPTSSAAYSSRKAISAARKLASKNECLIVAGSSHDSRTCYNTGHLFFPDCPVYGMPYHKQVSATEVNEYISVPAKRISICINAFGLELCVLICLDLADYSTVASIVQAGDHIDFLLVPACTENVEALERVAKSVSAALPGGVAIVNRYFSTKNSSSLFLFGKQVTSTEVIRSENYGEICLYQINSDDFHDQKRSLINSIDDKLLWFFHRKRLRSIPLKATV
jgi:hypothetical protein